jgi:hypothetical protein
MSEYYLEELLKPKIFVFCDHCNEFRSEKFVETLGIEEDFFGRDKLSFNCDRCGKFNQSLRIAK